MSNSGTKKQGALRRFLDVLGPGLITGASDDGPSGIGTYSQAGAQFGFDIGWTMLRYRLVHAADLPADGSNPGDQRAHRPP
jgi:Mn2+/Fe2+ NRAMP family transporter